MKTKIRAQVAYSGAVVNQLSDKGHRPKQTDWACHWRLCGFFLRNDKDKIPHPFLPINNGFQGSPTTSKSRCAVLFLTKWLWACLSIRASISWPISVTTPYVRGKRLTSSSKCATMFQAWCLFLRYNHNCIWVAISVAVSSPSTMKHYEMLWKFILSCSL